jgi:hypothetical protein
MLPAFFMVSLTCSSVFIERMMNMDQIPRNLPGLNMPNMGPPADLTNMSPTFTGPVDGFSRTGQEQDPALMSRPAFTNVPGDTGEAASVETQCYPGGCGPCPGPSPYPAPPYASWVTETAKHNGNYYAIAHPPGWKLVNTPTTTCIVSPDNPNAVVSLMWFNGMGQMDPKTLLNNTIQYNHFDNYFVLGGNPPSDVQTPYGSYTVMDQDAGYCWRGERCRSHATSLVNKNDSPYMAYWSGSIMWNQAPADKWDQYEDILKQISGSVRIVPPPPDTPPPFGAPPTLPGLPSLPSA